MDDLGLPTYQLKIKACNKGSSQIGEDRCSDVQVLISLPALPPVFEKKMYSATVLETEPVGTEVLKLSAVDPAGVRWNFLKSLIDFV